MAVRKRSITIASHRTSFSVEDRFWELLCALAKRDHLSVAALVALIDRNRARDANLSSAVRLHVLAEVEAGFRLADDIPAAPTDSDLG